MARDSSSASGRVENGKDDLPTLSYRGRQLRPLSVRVRDYWRPLPGRPSKVETLEFQVVGVPDAALHSIVELAGSPPTGAAAAHCVAIASVHLLDELAGWLIDPAELGDSWREREWPSFGVLAVAIEATARAIPKAASPDWRLFKIHGRQQLVDGLGSYASAHDAVCACLKAAHLRLVCELDAADFRRAGESWSEAAERLRVRGAERLQAAITGLDAWRVSEQAATRWTSWRGIESILEAEFARVLQLDETGDREGRTPTIGGVPADMRVQFAEARDGVPALDLPPTPKRTLQRWAKHHAQQLGRRACTDPAHGDYLVRGLQELHANPRRRTKQPTKGRS